MSACAQSAMARKPTISSHRPGMRALQRSAVKPSCECKECAKKASLLQRAAVQEHTPAEVPDIVYEVLKSPGQPLDRDTREFMEQRFNHDFSAVRVHTDARAAESARAVNARAYTVGADVAFSPGSYRPKSAEGRRLLAHELTHVVQQGTAGWMNERVVIDVHRTAFAEREADFAGNRVGLGLTPIATKGLVHRNLYLFREPALKLSSVSRGERAAGRATLKVVAELEGKVAIKSAARIGSPAWRFFWRAVAKKYAATLTLAATLAAADGPLPIGELIDAGLAVWMAWDMIHAWEDLWREAERLRSEPAASEKIPDEERQKKVRDCQRDRPYALMCDPDQTLYANDRGTEFWERSLLNFLTNFDISTLGTPYLSSRFDPNWCGGGLGEAWHVPVEGDREQTIELCECCDRDGMPAFHIVGKHKSRGDK